MNLIEKIEILGLLFSKPDSFIKEKIENKQMGEMLSLAFPQISFKEFSNENFIKNVLENIDRDYLYLFVGVSKPLASPYESSYYRKNSRLMDEPARRNIKLMKKWGLELDEDYKDLPDHISANLFIVSTLLEFRKDVEEEILKEEVYKDIKSVIKNLEWIRIFREKIIENEEAKFYSKIALALEETLKEI